MMAMAAEGAPTIKEWRELYEAAAEFKELACWKWMWDHDLIGVQDPETGMIGYCCVMGRAGEHFGIAAYMGSEGLAGYLMLATAEVPPTPAEMIEINKCLMASFENRGFLTGEDRRVLKRLGLRFRGTNAWPQFRSYEPGLHPWYLKSHEARFLTTCIRQTMGVARRLKDDPDLLKRPSKDAPVFLVRIPTVKDDGVSWSETWIEPPPPELPEIPMPTIDRERLELIKNALRQGDDIWEADVFYSPEAVRDGNERPWFPRMVMLVDSDAGMVLDSDITEQDEWPERLAVMFIGMVEGVGKLPRALFVCRGAVSEIMEPITSYLGIALIEVEDLEATEHVRTALDEDFLVGRGAS